MIVRKLDNNKVVTINLAYNEEQEIEFINKNPTGGFMQIDSLPSQVNGGSNYKWQNGEIVVDEDANQQDLIDKQVDNYKQFLNQTDFKFTSDYDEDTSDVE